MLPRTERRGGRRAAAVSPRPRRAARGLRARRAPLPLPPRPLAAARRLPRRRGVLRHQWLPDHEPAARRGADPPARRPAALLGAADPAALARADRDDAHGRARGRVSSTTRTSGGSGATSPSASTRENWWHIVHGVSYVDIVADAGRRQPFQHLWSLAVEEQFYVVWPLLFTFGLWVVGMRRVRAITICLAIVSWMAMVWFALHGNQNHAYLGTETRAFGPLTGAILAFLYPPRRRRPARAVPRAGAVLDGIGLLALVRVGSALPHRASGEHVAVRRRVPVDRSVHRDAHRRDRQPGCELRSRDRHSRPA